MQELDILIGRKAHHMMLYSPCQSLVTKLAIFAISASKHGGQFLTEVFIYSKETLLKGWRIFKMTAVALGPKLFSRTCIQGF